MTKLDHPLMCELLELFIDNNWIYFVNPFYTGGEVHDLLFDDKSDQDVDYTELAIPESHLKLIIY